MATTSVDLDGARVLVLGGSGVLGSHIAADMRGRGSSVMLAGRDATRLRQRATALGPDVPSVIFDLGVPTHARHVVDTTIQILGGLDGLVNAAGVVAFGSIGDLGDDTLDQLTATDLVGPLRVIREAVPHLAGGFIVNVTGVVAESPVAGMSAYSGVKAGLSAASLALGRELRAARIHVMDARPPHTETGLAGRAIAGSAPPMPRGLDPQDVARTIVLGLTEGRREIPSAAFSSE